jgi:hypothetical protein
VALPAMLVVPIALTVPRQKKRGHGLYASRP